MYFLGIISTIFLFSSGAYLLYRVEGAKHMSVSQHAALSKRASKYFGLCYIIGTTSYNLFLILYLVPKLHLGDFWIFLIILATACDWVLALVPELPGLKKLVHQIAAYLAATFAFVLVVLIALVPNQTAIIHYTALVSAIIMIGLGVTFVLPTTRRNFLFFQISFVLMFYLATLVAAYF